MERIRQDVEALAEAMRVASATVVSVQEEIKELDLKLVANDTSTKAVRRRCADYTRKRDKTRLMIDEGRAPDFFVAEKQFKQCAEIVDELEFEELELMEARDEMEILKRSLQQKLSESLETHSSATHAQSSRRPEMVRRYKELQPLKLERRKVVPRFLQSSYDSLRERERAPMVHMTGNRCTYCNLEAPPQMLLEISSGKRPHTCRGCSAWLLPPLEPEADLG